MDIGREGVNNTPMLFNSYAFLFGFLPVVLLGYYYIRNPKLQLWFLFFSSVFFYAYWSTKYVFLLLFTVVLDYYIARAIFFSKTKSKKTLLLLSSMGANLTILGFFKYFDLLSETINMMADHPLLPTLHLVLPIGISFYTFQSMSYVIDVYRGTSDAHANLLSFAGYVTLYPHQISGPLVRHNMIVPQLENKQTYIFSSDNFWRGLCFLVIGLSKKILIADRLASAVSPIVTNMHTASNLEAILSMLGYTMQLYFDFSGYSDMAVGLGLLMNIQFPQNFNSPYKSKSITEFWQRWHISLSSWLRDYLYISLGGNRSGTFKTYRNLLLTMTIGGLWHGGQWTFAFWGLFHGLLLVIERGFKSFKLDFLKLPWIKTLTTFALVNIGWIFFRSPDFKTAWLWLQKVLLIHGKPVWDIMLIHPKHKDRFFFALVVAFIIAFGFKNTFEREFKPKTATALLLGLLFAICLMYMGDESPFLYFQF